MVYTIPKEMSIATLPPEVVSELSKIELRILNALCRLWGQTTRKFPNQPNVPQPGLKWLAEQARCSYWTVSRAITHLRSFMLLKTHQKRTKTGEWRTNNYYLGFIWQLIMNGWKKMQENKDFSRLRLLANIALKKLNLSLSKPVINKQNDPPPPNTS